MAKTRKQLKTNTTPASNHVKALDLNKYSEIVKPVHTQAVQSGMLNEVDLRTRKGRLIYVAYGNYTSDKGGEENMSFAEKELARRCATLAMVAAGIEDTLAETQDLDNDALAQYVVVSRTLTSLLRLYGTKRIARDITQDSLKDYIGTATEV